MPVPNTIIIIIIIICAFSCIVCARYFNSFYTLYYSISFFGFFIWFFLFHSIQYPLSSAPFYWPFHIKYYFDLMYISQMIWNENVCLFFSFFELKMLDMSDVFYNNNNKSREDTHSVCYYQKSNGFYVFCEIINEIQKRASKTFVMNGRIEIAAEWTRMIAIAIAIHIIV